MTRTELLTWHKAMGEHLAAVDEIKRQVDAQVAELRKLLANIESEERRGKQLAAQVDAWLKKEAR